MLSASAISLGSVISTFCVLHMDKPADPRGNDSYRILANALEALPELFNVCNDLSLLAFSMLSGINSVSNLLASYFPSFAGFF